MIPKSNRTLFSKKISTFWPLIKIRSLAKKKQKQKKKHLFFCISLVVHVYNIVMLWEYPPPSPTIPPPPACSSLSPHRVMTVVILNVFFVCVCIYSPDTPGPACSSPSPHDGGDRGSLSRIPNKLPFHSGNPSVEITKGILHLFKEK